MHNPKKLTSLLAGTKITRQGDETLSAIHFNLLGGDAKITLTIS